MLVPHVKLGLLRRYYCYQVRRCLCKVRRVGPHFWLATAKGIGFHVHTVRIKGEGFVRILSALGFSPQLAKWGECHKCHPNLSIVFSDVTSLPPHGKAIYWSAWLVTHIFFAAINHMVHPLAGWKVRLKVFDHCNLGGYTIS